MARAIGTMSVCALVVLASLAGCSNAVDAIALDPSTGGAQLAGAMGSVSGFSVAVAEVDYIRTPTGMSVRLDAVDNSARWWVMQAVTFQGDTTRPQLVPGTVIDTGNPDTIPPGVVLYATGCSGPARGNYTFDDHPERMLMRVEDGPTADTVRVYFRAWYGGFSDQQVTGWFDYPR